jgi:23S rRNA pseudouridine955/2504/2580 synthase
VALKKFSFTISGSVEGQRLDQALAVLLGASPDVTRMGLNLSKGKIRKLIIAGAVYLNGGRVRIASKTCRPGARIEVYIDPVKLGTEGERVAPKEWRLDADTILFEDEWIIGVNKPAGLPTQPTLDEARANLYVLLQKFLKARDGDGAYVGLHHRLDRDTSGVMVFTKKKEANAEIGRAFAEHLARKTYLAIVGTTRPLPETWQVDNYLARDKGKGGKMTSVRSGGDRAITDFRTIAAVEGFALVEARPRTGRMHQIRVHLAGGGAPIIGDPTYGGLTKITGNAEVLRVMLHAAALTFPHPVTKLDISFKAPITPDFKQCLSQLRLPNLSLEDFGNETPS